MQPFRCPTDAPQPECCSVARCPETGSFRFVFDVAGAEVRADLTVSWLEDKGLAFTRLVTVDYVDANRATCGAVEAWVRANEELVLEYAMGAV